MKKLTNILKNLIFPIIFIVVSIVSYIQAALIRTLRFGGSLGGDFFPKLISLLTLLFSILWLVMEIRSLKKKSQVAESSNDAGHNVGFRNSLLFLIIFAAAVWLMKYVGFLLSAFLIVFFNYIFLKDEMKLKDLPLAIAYTAVVSFGIWYLFEKVFELVFPRGIFW
ncbi:tripartite tricarboxylate transporter TctB family protein [Fervidobacterium pennivorans subsp. shakshaketiis]|jgi:hypothetical protein|uniref:DUF1468 domain-containing protein n=1 Tax=Fervidobacterium pennivorans (strain DSM 9078 / Ven5) TaxID=771875 RepID=H9U9V2_FERPD|nr:tripartite tricarboxylate transporter TctB family protein [Fervidobacterium pennivorans]AFG34295.1 hypothetical protein Ferpe_0140 [Fervidobacterium pennivorans DSM 9078]